MSATSHSVRVWAIRRRKGQRGTTYAVRWMVSAESFQQTFSTMKLADAFRSQLLSAANAGTRFNAATGLPVELSAHSNLSWLEFAMEYASMKWPHASPQHRRGIAEALADVTLAVAQTRSNRPSDEQLRLFLRQHAFNRADRQEPENEEEIRTLRWLRGSSPPLEAFGTPSTLRMVLNALALTQAGTPAAVSTLTRKRATLNNALEYAVEVGHFPSNPLKRVKVRSPKAPEVVDRRVVVNPVQARALLEAVWETTPSLAALFGCLYYAGLRPAEARNLRRRDLDLPEQGWGQILLTGSHQVTGRTWSDTGSAGEERALKHRHARDTRRIPAHPELVVMLRRHLATFACGVEGRLFVSRTGRAGVPLSPPYQNPVASGALYRAWATARGRAFTPEQVESLLARRPYDLRHACVSTWLNAGVPAAQVADWAGHGVDVLLRVYAKCLDGAEDAALRRIEAALALDEPPTEDDSGQSEPKRARK